VDCGFVMDAKKWQADRPDGARIVGYWFLDYEILVR
jgi:hypothetical protein